MNALRLHTLMPAALLVLAGGAQAMSNNTAPSNWRFDSGTTFNGVNFDGVARIIMDDSYVCSGTLLAGGAYVLTAGHCVTGFSNFQIEFGLNNDVATATRGAAATYANPYWTGTLSYGVDVALIKLDSAVTGIQGFKLDTSSAVGKDVLMMGYGTTTQGNTATAPNWDDWGHGHWGVNRFDSTTNNFLNAAAAAGIPSLGSWSNAHGEEYVADYDDGSATRNTLGRIAGLTSNTGGDIESLISGGDSGGGDFVWNGSEWLVTGVHSWGWQFCGGRISPTCDLTTRNSSSWGDLMGSTAVYTQVDWINSVMVPEPGTYALMALGLLGVGAAARRRRID
ncbi:MAG TPA: trypsin-like serine protease [Burkholderiaceae bacterium]|nr:trypsin-like serine protease [Burkholderiaceae bacterium]